MAIVSSSPSRCLLPQNRSWAEARRTPPRQSPIRSRAASQGRLGFFPKMPEGGASPVGVQALACLQFECASQSLNSNKGVRIAGRPTVVGQSTGDSPGNNCHRQPSGRKTGSSPISAGRRKVRLPYLPGCPMFAESHAKMSKMSCGQLTAQPSWGTAIICRLSMNHHSGLQCEQPFRIKEALAKVVSSQNG
jgi:hypothetical protein